MKIAQNENGKWCLYSDSGEVLSEHDTEEQAKAALKEKQGTPMASMVSKVRATGDKGEADVAVLFDTGATLSFVLRDVAEKLATIVKMPKPYNIVIGDGSTLSVKEMAVLAIRAAGQTLVDTFLVLEKGVEDVILGEATMRKFGLKIDLEHGTIFSEMKVQPPIQNKPEKRKETPMWKKFLMAIGLAVAEEEVSEDQAVALLKKKLAAKKEEQPISPALLELLELEEGATESEARAKILSLKHSPNPIPPEKYAELEQEIRDKEALALIDRACRPGEGEMEGKLYPSEREWALKEAKKDLKAMMLVIKARPKVLSFLASLPEKKGKTVVIDELQTSINEQIGVSKETFLKYNTVH